METAFHNIGKNMWDVSLESECLVLEIDCWIWIYNLILGYFSMSTVVGCRFDLQLWASKFGFHGIIEVERYFCHFLAYAAQTNDYFIRVTVQFIFPFLLLHM